MKIILLHQAVPATAGADERDVLDQAAAVRQALLAEGHTVAVHAVTLDLAALSLALRDNPPDLVFNLVESLAGADRLLPVVPMLLETLHIPFTGNSADALLVTTHKLLAKRRLRQAGLPTPDWIEMDDVDTASDSHASPGDWICKSVWDHASAGLSADNLLPGVTRGAAARHLADRARGRRAAWFAERYVDGREFNVSIIAGPGGPRILPPAEIRFVDFPPGQPRILDYAAKWDPASFAYTHTPRTFDLAPDDEPLVARLRELAGACWRTFGLSGYARVDFRVDAAGRPWILEVNANPCLAPDAGLAAALTRAGLPFEEAIRSIVAAAGVTGPSAGRRAAAPAPAPTPPACTFRETVEPSDARRVRELVAATGFFHADEVAVAEELVAERLRQGEASGYLFLLADDAAGNLAGYACYGPTPCTASSYDLYWIAVAPAQQKCGLGRELARRVEAAIHARGGTRIYAETSSRPQYASTRAFYLRLGYQLASLLDDFYAPGDGKATYVKTV